MVGQRVKDLCLGTESGKFYMLNMNTQGAHTHTHIHTHTHTNAQGALGKMPTNCPMPLLKWAQGILG